MWSKIKKWAMKEWQGDVDLGVKYDLFDKICISVSGCLVICGIVEMCMNFGAEEGFYGWAALSTMGLFLNIAIRFTNIEKRLKKVLKDKNDKMG